MFCGVLQRNLRVQRIHSFAVWYKIVAGFNVYFYATVFKTVSCSVVQRNGTVVYYNLQWLVNVYCNDQCLAVWYKEMVGVQCKYTLTSSVFIHQCYPLWYKVVLGFSVHLTVLCLSPWKYKKVDSTNSVISERKRNKYNTYGLRQEETMLL